MFGAEADGLSPLHWLESLIITKKYTYDFCGNQWGGYLKSTLEAIAAGHPKDRIDELLPLELQPVKLKNPVLSRHRLRSFCNANG